MAITPGPSPHRRQPDIQRAETELLDRLKGDGFDETGETWAALRRRLIDYSYSLLVEILQVPGAAYRMARNHNGGLGVLGLARLSRNALDEESARAVAVEVLIAALPPFQRALREGRWDPAGPASLTTFFFGRCLMELPDRYQRWARHEAPGPVAALADENDGGAHDDAWLGSCAADPAERAVTAVLTDTLFAELDPEVRAMFELRVAGYTRAEIAEMFNHAGRPTNGGGPWTEAIVRTTLYRATREVKR